ncbi:MAG: hypothetical protein JOZ56_11725, partial [Actinobacteria bacterium]|nr:hypothetical protein [Actinomycetota bacterium]
GFLPELIRENPWLAAAVGALLLALAIGLPLALLGGSSRPAPTAASTAAPATTAPPATTAATTTAAAPAAAAPAVSATDVSIANFSLFQPPAQGFEFSLEAPSTAPAHETVTLDFGGPGLPTTRKVTLVAGQSVPMKYPTHGCGSWTVRVAAIDGKAIDSKGNPDLENGMTHPC